MYSVFNNIYLVLSMYILWCKVCASLSNHPKIDDTPELRQKFAQFHCFKLKTCTPGGDKACGFDSLVGALAEFEDTCTFHKVNCYKKGFFRLIDASICQNQNTFLSEKGDYDMFDRNLTSVD